jgi:hypothetical protein
MGAMVGCESPAGYRADPRACRAPASVGVSQSRINTLHADALQVDGDMVLTGAVVTGSGELGALRLPGAHIAGRLVLVEGPSVDSLTRRWVISAVPSSARWRA